MQIGILQTGHAPDALIGRTGDYGDMFERLLAGQGLSFRTFSVVDMEFPESVDDCEGWLLTGSRHGAYEGLPFIKPLEEFIRKAYAEAVPMVGICFGHQIIAQALGGKVEKFTGGWSVGPTKYAMNGSEITLNAWHQDQVVEKPAAARTIASNDFCAYAALVYDDRILSIQPHPEFGPDFIDGLIRTRGKGVVPDDRLAAATRQLDAPLDSNVIADRIAAFFKQPRAAAHG